MPPPIHSGSRRARSALGLVCLSIAVASGSAIADPQAPLLLKDASHVRATLLSDAKAITPGRPFRLAVRLEMDDGWHVNWVNPGDAGMAPAIAWKLPDGFKAGLIEWPLPERIETGPFVIFGYGKEVVLATEVRPPADLPLGSRIDLAADVSWLACAEACIPGSASTQLSLAVTAQPEVDAGSHARIEAALRQAPRHTNEWNVVARMEDETSLRLDLQTAAETTPQLGRVFLFPYDQGLIENAAAQELSASSGPAGRTAYSLRVERARMGTRIPERLTGVLVSETGWGAGSGPQAIEIDIPVAR